MKESVFGKEEEDGKMSGVYVRRAKRRRVHGRVLGR